MELERKPVWRDMKDSNQGMANLEKNNNNLEPQEPNSRSSKQGSK